MNDMPYVDLSFGVSGATLPADHGYGLYAAICRRCPALHGQDWLSIQTIPGVRDQPGRIALRRSAQLRLRLPVDRIPLVYPLAGQELTIGIHSIRLHIPQIHPLRPSETLCTRIAVIKGFAEEHAFLQAAQRQLALLGVESQAFLLRNPDGSTGRKTIKIKRFTVVGYSLGIAGLSEADSIRLQANGIGGKRRMGCGVFYGADPGAIDESRQGS